MYHEFIELSHQAFNARVVATDAKEATAELAQGRRGESDNTAKRDEGLPANIVCPNTCLVHPTLSGRS